MKTKLLKFALPIGMGMMLSVITVMGLLSATFTSCQKEETNPCSGGYPLWCKQTNKCCPAGYAYHCDGLCYNSPCPAGTVTVDTCS